MDVAERRRLKLLAREKQLDANGANPNTKAPAKPAEPTPIRSAVPEKETPVKKKPAEAVDFKTLNTLMKKRETYQVSKRVNRLGLAFLMGMIFHFCNFAYGVVQLNLYAAFACILTLHFWQW